MKPFLFSCIRSIQWKIPKNNGTSKESNSNSMWQAHCLKTGIKGAVPSRKPDSVVRAVSKEGNMSMVLAAVRVATGLVFMPFLFATEAALLAAVMVVAMVVVVVGAYALVILLLSLMFEAAGADAACVPVWPAAKTASCVAVLATMVTAGVFVAVVTVPVSA